MFNDDDVENVMYENGHWVWDNVSNELVFESDTLVPEEVYDIPLTVSLGAIEFKDDLDLMEQLKFRKRFQRKLEGEEDVILLQDIKDVVLYTAPPEVLTPTVINILHLSTTQRFLRALILYCQYYLQTAQEMSQRMMEMETKVRTTESANVELELRNNIEDLRLLVAKEYITMISGGEDFKKYHHMGPDKKMRSLSKKDILVFESILRISIQIVWLALGRRSLNKLELEIHRMFKSSLFNVVEHKLKTNYVAKMLPQERFVLLGHCVKRRGKLNARSPLMDEILCPRAIDFRFFGIGTMNFSQLTPRLRYMEQAMIVNEKLFKSLGMTMGILGLPRSRFDTMLKVIKMPTSTASSTASVRGRKINEVVDSILDTEFLLIQCQISSDEIEVSCTSVFRGEGTIASDITGSTSRVSKSSVLKSSTGDSLKLYSDIELPSKTYDTDWLPNDFPAQTKTTKHCNPEQRLKWMARATHLVDKYLTVMKRSHHSARSIKT